MQIVQIVQIVINHVLILACQILVGFFIPSSKSLLLT